MRFFPLSVPAGGRAGRGSPAAAGIGRRQEAETWSPDGKLILERLHTHSRPNLTSECRGWGPKPVCPLATKAHNLWGFSGQLFSWSLAHMTAGRNRRVVLLGDRIQSEISMRRIEESMIRQTHSIAG